MYVYALPKTNSSPLKNGAWETILTFLGLGMVQRFCKSSVSRIAEMTLEQVHGHYIRIKSQFIYTPRFPSWLVAPSTFGMAVVRKNYMKSSTLQEIINMHYTQQVIST